MFQIKEWVSCISSSVSFVVPTLASLRLEGDGPSLEDKARVIWDVRRKNLGSGPSAVPLWVPCRVLWGNAEL